MEELKDTLPHVRHTEISNRITMEQLVQEGDALEAREKKFGIWEAVNQHKVALVHSRFLNWLLARFALSSNDLPVLAAYSCAAVYVSLK